MEAGIAGILRYRHDPITGGADSQRGLHTRQELESVKEDIHFTAWRCCSNSE